MYKRQPDGNPNGNPLLPFNPKGNIAVIGPLAKESDVCLSTGKPAEVCVLGMTPTTSTTAMTAVSYTHLV